MKALHVVVWTNPHSAAFLAALSIYRCGIIVQLAVLPNGAPRLVCLAKCKLDEFGRHMTSHFFSFCNAGY